MGADGLITRIPIVQVVYWSHISGPHVQVRIYAGPLLTNAGPSWALLMEHPRPRRLLQPAHMKLAESAQHVFVCLSARECVRTTSI